MSGQPTLGLLLVRANKITREQLYEALREQRATGARLGDILYSHGWIGEEELTLLLAQQLDIPFVDAKQLEKIPPLLIDKLPAKVAGEYRVLPVKLFKGKLTVAMDDQKTRNYLDELSYLTGTTCVPALAAPGAIRASIKRHYGLDLPERTEALPPRKDPKAKPAPAPVAERPIEKLEALPVAKTDAQGRDYVEVKNAAGQDQVFLLTEVVEEVVEEAPPAPTTTKLRRPVTETRRVTAVEPHDPSEDVWPEDERSDEPVPADRLVPAPVAETDDDEDEAHDNFLAPEARNDDRPVWRPKGDKKTSPPAPAPAPREPGAAAAAPAAPKEPEVPAPAIARVEPAPRREEPVPEKAAPAVTTEAPIPDFDIVRAAEKLFEQTDATGIAQVVVSFARNLVDRAILFDVSGDPYLLLARAGSFLDDDDRGLGFQASAEELVLLGVIAQTQQPSYGPTPPGEMYDRFFRALGLMKPPCILLYPLVVGGKTKAVLFGGLGKERPPDEFGDLQLLFKEAATAWEILLS